ncbi:hypothetical protein HPP92_027066 [Vanilla planifolia]|uniref:Mitochondrial carrier protein n=1 Tax=Vanilla planifolia TaxID=51239 RepID=A0A835PDE6_VANPL|nr:hypothetical protein HPP92_027066 [Vanilla planifolia]
MAQAFYLDLLHEIPLPTPLALHPRAQPYRCCCWCYCRRVYIRLSTPDRHHQDKAANPRRGPDLLRISRRRAADLPYPRSSWLLSWGLCSSCWLRLLLGGLLRHLRVRKIHALQIPRLPPFFIPPDTAGAMGNVVSSAIMVPKELITQRMQAGAAGRSWEVLRSILEKDGILGLYTGYSATLLRNLPAGILSYSSFEYLKGFLLSRTGKGYLEPVHSVCCGALAGAISASLTTPLDVVKTRLMTQASEEAKTKIFQTVRQILAEEGWQGLARGIGPRVLHSACFAAIGYFAFETAKLAILHQYAQHRNEHAVDEVAV